MVKLQRITTEDDKLGHRSKGLVNTDITYTAASVEKGNKKVINAMLVNLNDLMLYMLF